MSTEHFANLTNGIACAPAGASYCRIPSTWCEQNRWADVLWTLPADLYVAAASGSVVVIHDQSERARLTRAQWLGLSFIRYALSASWGLDEPAERSRSGMNLTPHWRRVWSSMPKRVRHFVSYYRPLVVADRVAIETCICERVEAHRLVTPSVPRLLAATR